MNKLIQTPQEILNLVYDENTNALVTNIAAFPVQDSNNPLAVDGDSLYLKDIDLTRCDTGSFLGTIDDLMKDVYTPIIDSSNNNPKSLKIMFHKSLLLNSVALGVETGDFSNVKILGVTSRGTFTVIDESTNNTKYKSRNYRFSADFGSGNPASVVGIIGLLVEFHTVDMVAISNFYVNKWTTNISIIQGQNESGGYTDFQATKRGNFKVALTEYQGDAFGRLRVSEPYTIFDNTMVYDTKNLFWSNLLNGGTSVQNRSLAKSTLTVTSNGQYAIEQSKMRFKYQPGKSSMILMTGLLKTEANTIKRIGYFDVDNGTVISNTPKNGIYFENNNGVLSWNIANNGVVTETHTKANWNVDILDGIGLSGYTLDINKVQIWFMDLEWLGVGTVRCGFVLDGEINICTEFHHANHNFINVYMANANLPLNYSLISTGGSGTLEHICSSVISEGGYNPQGLRRSTYTPTSFQIASGVTETAIGIRLKADSFNASVVLRALSIIITTSGATNVKVLFNPTYTGTVTWIDQTNSTVQIAYNNNNVITAGYVFEDRLVADTTNNLNLELESMLRLGKNLDGTFDEIWVCLNNLSNQTETYFASLSWLEQL